MFDAIKLRNVDVMVFRAPCKQPVRTAFGVMHDRPAVLVRIRDADGVEGWGEVWCNFPSVGAEHRARLLRSVYVPMLEGALLTDPQLLSAQLEQRVAILALQSGEPGPLAQALAGIDQALWDLRARRAGMPLWKLLRMVGDDAGNDAGSDAKNHAAGAGTTVIASVTDTPMRVRAYASGLGPVGAIELALAHQLAGYREFKLKVGFEPAQDLAHLRELRAALGDEARLMVDANQGWDLARALQMCPALSEFDLEWIEEPLRADAPAQHWQQVAASSASPIAAGENIVGMDNFMSAISSATLGVMQPDVAKWGGVSACLQIGRAAVRAGLRYCPHYLGGGIGLAVSAHLLAAVGGDGMLEVDANPNPLRELLWPQVTQIEDGMLHISEHAGIGAPPELAALDCFAVSLPDE